MQYESERIEYKSQLTDEIYKEVIAFANTDGGIIYIGVDDQGNATGIDDVDGTYTRLTNGVRDAIQPDVTDGGPLFCMWNVTDDMGICGWNVSEGLLRN